jgi:hypothetical protein
MVIEVGHIEKDYVPTIALEVKVRLPSEAMLIDCVQGLTTLTEEGRS